MKNLLTILLLFAASAVWAQKGTIKGKVTDAKTGEEIIGANVTIEGTAIGASTGITGEYQFYAEPGTYTIRTSYIGYKSFRQEGVAVKADEATVVDIKIAEDVEALAEVVVEGKADKSSENILLMQRKDAAIAIESIGARELSARGVSDVKAGLVKMSGVSQVSSRGVYVRGLGDRYNNAYLNGLPLPSPNPSLKVISLDLFPTAIVRNIDVSKTYSVNQFGDMSGASVNIITKDAADEDFISFGVGLNYNTQTTFRNFLVNRQSATAAYVGVDGKNRTAPIPVDLKSQHTFSEAGNDPFSGNFSPEQISAPLDNSYNLQANKSFKFGSSKLGITFAGAYKNSFRTDEGINNVLNADQLADRDFIRERYRYETNLTSLLGAQYSLNSRHYVNLNYLFINNSNNDYIASQGNTLEEDNPNIVDLRRLRSRYTQTQLHDVQATISNKLSERLQLQWGGSYASAVTDEPDRIDLSFTTAEGVMERGQFSDLGSNQNQRYYQETNEQEAYAFAEGSYGFGGVSQKDSESSRHKLVVGFQVKNKERQEALRSFQLQTRDGFAAGELDLNNLDAVFTDANYAAGQYGYLDANADGSSQASAERLINAGYVYADLNLNSRLKLVPGVRAEYTNQSVLYKRLGTSFNAPFKEVPVNNLDLLPALNVKYDITDQHVLRLGASKTLTRPSFRELIPVPFVNENLQSFTGNPDLINSDVLNLDLKYDIYPKPGELVSVGAFYKYIDNPIEQIQTGVNFIMPFNIPSASVYGLELEVSKRASSLFTSGSRFVNGLIFDGNMSYMITDVNTDLQEFEDDEQISKNTQAMVSAITNSSRGLQGASPYILNLSMGYDDLLFRNSDESNIRLTYNIFGKRIYSVGTLGAGDVYELPFSTLDFVVQNTWKNGLGVKLSAKNLLNPAIQMEQAAGTKPAAAERGDIVMQSYRVGINLGVSVTYRLNFRK